MEESFPPREVTAAFGANVQGVTHNGESFTWAARPIATRWRDQLDIKLTHSPPLAEYAVIISR